MMSAIAFILFDLILYVAINTFSVMSGRVFLGLTNTKQGRCVLLKDTTQHDFFLSVSSSPSYLEFAY